MTIRIIMQTSPASVTYNAATDVESNPVPLSLRFVYWMLNIGQHIYSTWQNWIYTRNWTHLQDFSDNTKRDNKQTLNNYQLACVNYCWYMAIVILFISWQKVVNWRMNQILRHCSSNWCDSLYFIRQPYKEFNGSINQLYQIPCTSNSIIHVTPFM